MTLNCPAKINLYLNTLRKRSDGFHEIESIFHAVSLYDRIHLTPKPGKHARFQLKISDKSTFLTKEILEKDFLHHNILSRVYRYFRQNYAIPGVEVVLEKHIPIGAGLGGGSSDAAGLMVGVNRMFNLGLSRKKLLEIGAEFGSDVPFFLVGGMAWVGGRGEVIEKSPLSLNQKILLCYPDRLVNTAQSYREFNTLYPRKSLETFRKRMDEMILVKSHKKGDIKGDISYKRDEIFRLIGGNLFNSFQKKTLKFYSDLDKIYKTLKKNADYCLMSGSGSSFFAWFHDIIYLDRFYSQFRKVYPNTFRVRLIASGVRISESKIDI